MQGRRLVGIVWKKDGAGGVGVMLKEKVVKVRRMSNEVMVVVLVLE